MTEFDTYLRLLAAIVVPWSLGTLLATVAFGRQRSVLTYTAHGYLIGIVAELIVIRAFDAIGLPFSFWPMLSILLALTIALTVYTKPLKTAFNAHEKMATQTLSDAKAWRVILMSLLLCIVFFQIALVFNEAILRPTFPWDAWRGWEAKTLQFFENRSLTAQIVTIGNYGSVSTQAQLWLMLALDEPRSNLSHLAWVFAYIAIGMCLYAHVAMHRTRLTGLIAAAAFLTTPYAATHAALSGYADLWLCLAFTLGIFAAVEYWRKPNIRLLMLALVYALVCVQTKRAGLGMGLILLAVLFAKAVKEGATWAKFVAAISALGILTIALAASGLISIQIFLPGFGEVALNNDYLTIGDIGRYPVTYAPNSKPFMQAIFEFGSWNLLGVLTLLAALSLLFKRSYDPSRQPISLAIIASSAFLAFYFVALSPESAADHTALSRALLPLVPTLLAFIATVVPLNVGVGREESYGSHAQES